MLASTFKMYASLASEQEQAEFLQHCRVYARRCVHASLVHLAAAKCPRPLPVGGVTVLREQITMLAAFWLLGLVFQGRIFLVIAFYEQDKIAGLIAIAEEFPLHAPGC